MEMHSTSVMTLAIDCGGLFIKGSVLDSAGTLHAQPVAVPTPYPLSPTHLIETIDGISKGLPNFDRLTVGMPGMLRHGVVVHTPHYINAKGPRTRIEPELEKLVLALVEVVSQHDSDSRLVYGIVWRQAISLLKISRGKKSLVVCRTLFSLLKSLNLRRRVLFCKSLFLVGSKGAF
mgnify:CR=1 FL=1